MRARVCRRVSFIWNSWLVCVGDSNNYLESSSFSGYCSLSLPLAMADLEESDRPVVTGISPTVGLPGTKVTIRGENLGESKDDVIGKQLQ